ncbi:MAG: sensor domain-containing diguanylate cyclase [Curvibacter sp.]|nr:sensor domain-containing diguanylate cyclase [Curvibacter sp.]
MSPSECDCPLPLSPAWLDQGVLDVLTGHQGCAVALLDSEFRIRYVNPACAGWFQARPADLCGRHAPALQRAAGLEDWSGCFVRALAGETLEFQWAPQAVDGGGRQHAVRLEPWRDAQARVLGVICSGRPLPEPVPVNDALRAANQKLSSHMENSPLAVVEMDARLGLVHCSSRATRWFGWEGERLQGQPVLELPGLSPGSGALRDALWRLQSGQELQNRAEATHWHPDGTLFHSVWFNSALTNEDGETVSILSQIEDVTDRVRATEQLWHLARHDSLTGLVNRRALMGRMDEALDSVRRRGGRLVLLFLDLDGFKAVNDRLGHSAGDDVLRLVARRLRAAVRQTDTLARLGGDEFVVLLDEDVSDPAVELILGRILAAFEDPFQLPQGALQLGVSVGVAVHTNAEGTVDDLVQRADQAMYQAKRSGKGGISYAACCA